VSEALAHAKTLFEQFLKDGPTRRAVGQHQKYLRQALPQLIATNRNLLNELGIINRFDQALDFTYKITEIQKMTAAQIKAAMKRHMNADSLGHPHPRSQRRSKALPVVSMT
jgi:zinc protease